MPPRARAGVRN